MNRCSQESQLPVEKTSGSKVTGGTVNGTGSLVIQAERVGAEQVDKSVVDKLASITEGKPRLVVLVTADTEEERDLLRLAASLERESEHPIAQAIVTGVVKRFFFMTTVTAFISLPPNHEPVPI